MKTLFLSSAGVRFPIIEHEFRKILPADLTKIRIGFITTAYLKEENIEFAQQDLQKLKDMGFQVTLIDLSGKSEPELEMILQDQDIVYVEGGNTYVLLAAINQSGFDKLVRKLLDKGIIYMGVSAGSYVACPTIEMCEWSGSHENIPNLKDLSAMNLVPFILSVHYNRPKYQKIQNGVLTSKFPVKLLTDDQAILIRDNEYTLVGKGEEIKITSIPA